MFVREHGEVVLHLVQPFCAVRRELDLTSAHAAPASGARPGPRGWCSCPRPAARRDPPGPLDIWRLDRVGARLASLAQGRLLEVLDDHDRMLPGGDQGVLRLVRLTSASVPSGLLAESCPHPPAGVLAAALAVKCLAWVGPSTGAGTGTRVRPVSLVQTRRSWRSRLVTRERVRRGSAGFAGPTATNCAFRRGKQTRAWSSWTWTMRIVRVRSSASSWGGSLTRSALRWRSAGPTCRRSQRPSVACRSPLRRTGVRKGRSKGSSSTPLTSSRGVAHTLGSIGSRMTDSSSLWSPG